LNIWLAFTPCFIATRATEEPAPSVSSTINRRSSALRLRRGDANDKPTARVASDMMPSSRNRSALYTRPTPCAYPDKASSEPFWICEFRRTRASSQFKCRKPVTNPLIRDMVIRTVYRAP
jgi:hypothetical protein